MFSSQVYAQAAEHATRLLQILLNDLYVWGNVAKRNTTRECECLDVLVALRRQAWSRTKGWRMQEGLLEHVHLVTAPSFRVAARGSLTIQCQLWKKGKSSYTYHIEILRIRQNNSHIRSNIDLAASIRSHIRIRISPNQS
jgi:hypothetical protein